MKNNKGFTLIEILIVVMLIGILSGIMLRVINVGDVRRKTRDSQRIADLKKIQTALELYFVDNRLYPESGGWTDLTGGDEVSSVLKSGYVNVMPTEQREGIGSYKYKSDGSTYFLVAQVELEDSFDDSPCTENPYGQGSGCYEVQNPL